MDIDATPPPMMKHGEIDSYSVAQKPNQINKAGIELIKKFEGLRLNAYRDPKGIWTIGYGCTEGVKPGMSINQAQAEDLLKKCIDHVECGLNQCILVPLTPNEFSALGCLVYNIGMASFLKSTLFKFINAKKMSEASAEFLKWNRISGKESKGLSIRRKAEQELFLKPQK